MMISKRTCLIGVMLLLALTLCFTGVSAQPVKPELPGVLTSAGQSTDALMLDVLLNRRLDMKIAYQPLVKVADLKGIKTLIVSVGASSKGLGAAGLDTNAEVDRVKALMDYAKAEKLSVILAHTGGSQRRGALSDQMIRLVAPVAKWYVVVKTGNSDQLFDRLAETNKAQLILIDVVNDAGPAIQNLFK